MSEAETQLAQTVAEMAKDLRKATNELTQTTTVLRQHIGEQQSINRRRERWEQSIETRVGQQELRHAALQAGLPSKPVDAQDLDQDLQRVEKRLGGIERKVDSLAGKVAYWSGGIAAIVTIAGFLFKWLIGGGS